MSSTLCEAVARCHLRRLRGVAAAAPLPAAVVALVVVTAPVISFRLGGAVGDEPDVSHVRSWLDKVGKLLKTIFV